MNIIIKIIGILIAVIAIVYQIKPQIMLQLIKFFKQGIRIYIAALIRFVLAIIFLLAASQSHIPWVITLLGILFIASGVLIVVLGPEKIRTILEWYETQPVIILRLLAALALIIGVVIVFAA